MLGSSGVVNNGSREKTKLSPSLLCHAYRLDYDALWFPRLVVDTGLHHTG